MEQQLRLDQERPGRGRAIQAGLQGPDGNLRITSVLPRRDLPTRGFFTNSSSDKINNIGNLMDPTSLAVFGILLTLIATSVSLVRGS